MLPLFGSVVVISATALLLRYHPVPTLLGLGGVAAAGLALRWRQVRRDRLRGWRFHRHDRGGYLYSEWHDGTWRTLRIDGETRVGRTRQVFYLPTPEAWRLLPAWANQRRDEIIARLQSACPPPVYAYAAAPDRPSSG